MKPCLCRHSFDEHLDNAEHPCMVILRHDGARSVCACTHYTPTKAKSPQVPTQIGRRLFMTRKMYSLEVFENQDGEVAIIDDAGGVICFSKEQAEIVARWIVEVAKEIK